METKTDSVFIDLAAAAWKRKWMVLGITVAAIILALAYTLTGTGKASADSIPKTTTWVKRIAMIRAPELKFAAPPPPVLAAGENRLVLEDNLADPKMRVRLAKTIGESADLVDTIVRKFDLAKRYGMDESATVPVREAFNKHMKIDSDAAIEVIVVAFEDTDPAVADHVNAAMIDYIDTRLAALVDARLKATIDRIDSMLSSSGALRPSLEAQKNLAVLQRANPAPMLAVVDFESTTLPLPSRGRRTALMAIAGVFSAFFLSLFLAIGIESIERAINDPVTVARFRTLAAKRSKK